MAPSKVILVTGANRGIGFAIIQSLAKAQPENTYLLGVRTISSGEEAISQLRALSLTANLETIQLDVTSDEQIRAAVEKVREDYGRLDVLINNAAFAANPKEDLSDFRQIYQKVFDANITSVALLTQHFLPLLKASPDPRVINISSSRASVAQVTKGTNPPTACIPYSVSKTALNMVTFEMAKVEKEVLFYVVSPGHCKTAFNGFRGLRDPVDGARVVVELVGAAREKFAGGFWEFEEGEMRVVPW